jgi:hypothetical protein
MAEGPGTLIPVEKPRVRVRAGSRRVTNDSFMNVMARVGADPGSDNQSAGAFYNFNPISRYRTELEWCYRGSWICRVAVDAIADDMTRAGIEFGSELSPDDGNELFREMIMLDVWNSLNLGEKWSRLYGGSLVVPVISGQDPSTPLKIDSIAPGQFKGLLVLDRWMVQPSLNDLVNVEDLDKGSSPSDLGLPRSYQLGVGMQGVGAPYSGMTIHHSRALRLDGLDLPFWQKISENYWGLSVIEPLYDRLVAFDSTTQGAAQLVYKAHLRTWKMADLDRLFGEDEAAAALVMRRVAQVARFQSNEGMTLIDAQDDIEMSTYSFAGLADMMLQFGQQLAGSIQVPLTRMFGQAPAGLNSTGESDLRNYEDGILHRQERRFRRPVDVILQCVARSKKITLPPGFWWTFKQLRQLTDEQKGSLADQVTTAVTSAEEQGLVSKRIAAKELQQSSRRTGIFTNIDDKFLAQLDDGPPPAVEAPGMGGGEADYPGMEAGAGSGENEQPPDGDMAGSGQETQAEDAFSAPRRPKPHLHVHLGDAERVVTFQGFPIFIECFAGQERVGLRGWATKMPCRYGFIRMSGSAEGAGEGMDVFLGEDENAGQVFVVNQLRPETGGFDEHKCLMGFSNRMLAMRAYQKAFADGSAAARLGSVRAMTVPEFRRWLETADETKAA